MDQRGVVPLLCERVPVPVVELVPRRERVAALPRLLVPAVALVRRAVVPVALDPVEPLVPVIVVPD